MSFWKNILDILHQEKTTEKGEGQPSSFAPSGEDAPQAEKPEAAQAEGMDPVEAELDREIAAFYAVLVDTMGSDRLVLQAGKLGALTLMRSPRRADRVLALERILLENPTLGPAPREDEIPQILSELSERIAEQMARKNVEDSIEKKVNDKLEQEHQDYVKDIRLQVLKEEKGETESPQDAEKREKLERMNKIHLTQSVMELLRPQSFDEIVGQERAVKSLMAKLSSPYPQHLLLYGPPGLGKTFLSACIARVVSEHGFSVVYDTAVNIFAQFETQKFSRDEDDTREARDGTRRYLGCDLLILDDLGSEMTTPFVQSALYQLLNTRLTGGNRTIISTNLTPDDIRRRYTPQLASRLEGEYHMLRFFGEDIRLQKKQRL